MTFFLLSLQKTPCNRTHLRFLPRSEGELHHHRHLFKLEFYPRTQQYQQQRGTCLSLSKLIRFNLSSPRSFETVSILLASFIISSPDRRLSRVAQLPRRQPISCRLSKQLSHFSSTLSSGPFYGLFFR